MKMKMTRLLYFSAIERYVDCIKDVTDERCEEKDTEWLEAITNYYILRQSQQFYQCNFGKCKIYQVYHEDPY